MHFVANDRVKQKKRNKYFLDKSKLLHHIIFVIKYLWMYTISVTSTVI